MCYAPSQEWWPAATSATFPGVPDEYQNEMRIAEGQEDPTRKIVADLRFVSSGYFTVMRTPILEGEPCQDYTGPDTVIVNRSFENQYFSRTQLIGRHLKAGAASPTPVIGGIVGDAHEEGLNTEPMATVYWCLSAPVPDPNYLVRTRGDPLTMADTLRRAIQQVEPSRSVFDLIQSHLSDAFAEDRLRTILLTLSALTAVSLACVGLYGTLTYLITVRHREIACGSRWVPCPPRSRRGTSPRDSAWP
jgi:putative ABC transport system permease protein